MKKVYEKPQMTYESFDLSTGISASCDYRQNAMKMVCPITDPEFGYILFNSDPCTPGLGPGKYDQPCYDVPVEDYVVFSS